MKHWRWLAWVLILIALAGCGSLSDGPAPIESRTMGSAPPAAPAVDAAAGRDPSAALREQLYSQYKLWKGTPYRMGGLSSQGIDCSGLVYLTFKATRGLVLPRSTDRQAELGRSIGSDVLQPGDLVFFRTGLFDRHVGIYLEQGRFLHVSRSSGVMISALDDDYWKGKYWQARRLEH